jgi:hypothetical protein
LGPEYIFTCHQHKNTMITLRTHVLPSGDGKKRQSCPRT